MCPVRTEGPKRNQKVLAPSYGLRCAQVPSLRLCSVGTLPRAIHGPSRLSRHPCRSTHSTEPPLGLPEGQADQKHCAEAADRPACLVRVYCTISVAAAEGTRLRFLTRISDMYSMHQLNKQDQAGLNRQPSTSSKSHPSRSNCAETVAIYLRSTESASCTSRLENDSISWVTATTRAAALA